MNEINMKYYQDLAGSSSDVFFALLSKNEYKTAVCELIGSQIPIDDLGLNNKTITALSRSGITTIVILIDYFESEWASSTTYLYEVSHQLEAYIRNLVSEIVPKEDVVQNQQSTPVQEIMHFEAENNLRNDHHSDEMFIQCDNMDELTAYFKDHPVPIDELDLSVRANNSLRKAGIRSLSDLLICTNEQIITIKNLGTKSIEEIHRSVFNYLKYYRTQQDQPKSYSLQNQPEKTEQEIQQFSTENTLQNQVGELFFQCDNIGELTTYFTEHPVLIDDLDLSVRLYNRLRRAGIRTLSDLLSCTTEQIITMKNLGTKLAEEIRQTVTAFLDDYKEIPETEESSPENEQTDDSFLSLNINDDCETDIRGSKLFKENENRKRIIRFFSDKRINLAQSGLSVRAVNALARGLGGLNNPFFSELLRIFPDGLSEIRNIGTKTKHEIYRLIKGVLDQYTSQILKCLDGEGNIPFSDSDIQKKLLSLYTNKTSFYGFSFKEFREKMPDIISDDDIRTNVGALLKAGELEYVDFRCYKVYPKFSDYCASCPDLNEKSKTVLLGRMQGKHLNELGDETSVTRERIRQIEKKALRIVYYNNRGQLFDEDYFRYLYENYNVPKDAWIRYLHCSEATLWYLQTLCGNGGKAPIEDALDDPLITVNQKYRLQKYLDSQMLWVQGEPVPKDRIRFERSVLSHYCQDETTFDEFTEIYNTVLRENHVPDSDSMYYTENNKRSRSNHMASCPFILWKQGNRLRYYDTDSRDFNELLNTLNLGQYQNIEFSVDKFIMDFPELMHEYDIRDGNELHGILKTIVDPAACHEIDFTRQPIIRFGTFDRIAVVKEIIAEYSPIPTDELVNELRKRYGYREGMIRGTILPNISKLYHNGYYSVDFKMIPEERLNAFRRELTEDYYEFDELKELYTDLFPGADPQDINPRMMKTMGFVVNNNYLLQHYTNAEEYFHAVLTKEDVFDLEPLRKKYNVSYSTFNAHLYKMLQALDILYFEPNQLLNIRRLIKMGITKEMLIDYRDSAIGLLEDGQFFTVDSLRRNGFSHPLDNLGFDSYFYNALLSYDARISSNTLFNGIVLLKGDPEQKPSRIDFIAYLLKGKTAVTVTQLEKEARNQYGIEIGKDPYDLTRFISDAADRLGMYFDRTMGKVYRDKSYYYEDLERTETEE